MRRLSLALLACALAVGVIAAPVAAKQPDPGMNIVKAAIYVNTETQYTGLSDTLIELVVKLDLAGPLSQRGRLTVFAPIDPAFDALFAKLGVADVDEAIAALGKPALTNIVLFHVARGNRDAAEVLGSKQIRMLSGDFAMVDAATTPYPTIDGAGIIVTNVPASNGIIHAVNGVLLP